MWFTSDLHFGHKNIIKFCPETRPYKSVEHMNESLIDTWNNRVESGDHIYVLGDFAFCTKGQLVDILAQLNGHIHIVLGNHDNIIRTNKNNLRDMGLVCSIKDYEEVNHYGIKIVLSHYAMRVWNGSHRGQWHLYGHSHGTLPARGRSCDVGIDNKDIPANGGPIHVSQIEEFMVKRPIYHEDYHGTVTRESEIKSMANT